VADDKPGQHEALFVNLVMLFQNAAMQQMGKMTNPVTGKVERNLDQARFSIDMIEMLKAKTHGNLSGELEKFIDSTLTNLQLNYVDEAAKPAAEQPAPETGEEAGGGPDSSDVEPGGEAGEGAGGETPPVKTREKHTGQGEGEPGPKGGSGGEGAPEV
jgi:hypothetical protein